MAYKGLRKRVPAARYGALLDVIEATGWTYDELLAQPWDMVTEMMIRLQKRSLAQAQQVKHGK